MADTINQNEELKFNNKTFSVNKKQVVKKWYLVDVQGKVLGRCATKIASILKGKAKTHYTPNVDNGDYVAVINASKIHLTGKKWQKKVYYRHSGYPGGLFKITAGEMMKKFPTRVVEKAIFGMLPHTKLGNQMRKKLFVYPNESHRHESQKPKILEV
ncbi:50S ribosomal protein L13 [Candidatus Phytoplasma ziziphi]|uniref:Large ribosomal subunit protein uL13 n=1 Tax=Ziziphus jujuba witches'-broom phytoplasma TaxID=135727 RepID=A0A660HMT3_ZIZJU|nr:50S ribosomal protein L13 [Candidatus Phytoplasma ziziphi]AYJ01331.1 50S ribosomal protein L13 [Candidatus Phytoplasma ziziphi]